jgi:hypothetical protein
MLNPVRGTASNRPRKRPPIFANLRQAAPFGSMFPELGGVIPLLLLEPRRLHGLLVHGEPDDREEC